MQGDRVVVGDGYDFKADPNNKKSVMGYTLIMNEGRAMTTPDGSLVVKNLGGILVGSTGTINGPVVNVHRSYLHNYGEYQPAVAGGKDFVQMIPVKLDYYQAIAYVPVDNTRIFTGAQ